MFAAKWTLDNLGTRQTLDRLVGNAIVHSLRSVIREQARSVGGGHLITVTNEGREYRGKGTMRYFNASLKMGLDSIGFGLGLYLAKQYVQAQRGELTLEESEKGCHFKIWLPH